MNKNVFKKTSIAFLLFLLTVVIVNFSTSSTEVKAASNTEYLTTGSGSYLTYRNSSEKVLALSEFDYPVQEYRACWVSNLTGDINSYTTETAFKNNAKDILDNMEKMGLNVLVFHIRTHNNALYDSDLNPRATWWANVNFDVFDPFEWLIEECHSRGIELHAWLNPYRINNSYVVNATYPEGHPVNNPNNILKNSAGAMILDPGSQEVRDFIVDTCMEVIEKYDVDAIHFDDYFYISGVATELSGDYKREQVNLFIKQLHDEMTSFNEKNNRNVVLGISPSGIYRNGSYQASPTYNNDGTLKTPVGSNTAGFAHYDNYLYSDTLYWINQGWIDYITPQSYWGLEHTAASFAALTRWWSWAVANRDVNLYMGIGIYMALESTSSGAYWQKNKNEVKNQLLNAAMYDAIDGVCFFKYSTMLSSNTIVKNGVDLISNDYYNKKIPSAVQKSYVSKVASYPVNNLILVNNTLTWDVVDNVRGYMVYEVPKGEAFDKNNLDYLLEYTQDTSITIKDVDQYDYYVCSVNRANYISTETKLSVTSTTDAYQQVINRINNLPTTITLDNEAEVNTINKIYNSLSADDKAKVTNYHVLEQAIVIIAKLKELKLAAENYLKTLTTDLEDGVVLTPPSKMSWDYKNVSDASKYNIATGKKLISYLGKTNITLVLKATDSGVTYTTDVSFNLSVIPSTYTSLFYRNDPSCLTPNDSGSYTEGGSGYIGWSSVILYIGKYALPIALGNYHELSSSTIPQTNWSSCASVYVNKTLNSVSITPNQVYQSASATYGYFIIGANGLVRLVSNETPYDTAVTLNQGEAIFYVRYLDRIYDNSPFTDLSWITTSTQATIAKYSEQELGEEEIVQIVINAIDALPETITVDDETKINDIVSLYNSLSDSSKTKVTNYNQLEKAILALAEAKEYQKQLTEAKKNAIDELNNYVDLNNYSSNNRKEINSVIASAKTLIESATTIEDVITIKNSTEKVIDEVLTLDEELALAKQNGKKTISSYLDLSKYSDTAITKIKEIIKKGNTTIDLSTSVAMVESNVNLIKGELDEVLTIEEELAKAKLDAISEMYVYVDNKDYNDYYNRQVILYCVTVEEIINNSTTLAQINEELIKAKQVIDTYPTNSELEQMINQALEELALVKTTYEGELGLSLVIEKYDLAIANLSKSTTIEDIQKYQSRAQDALDDEYKEYLDVVKEEKKNSLTSLVDKKYASHQKVIKLINQTKSQIREAKTITEVNEIVEQFENQLIEVYKEIDASQKSGCNKEIAKLITTLISVTSLIVLIVKKH